MIFVKPLNKDLIVAEYAAKAMALLPAAPTFDEAANAAAIACDANGCYAGNWDEVKGWLANGKVLPAVEKLVYYWC